MKQLKVTQQINHKRTQIILGGANTDDLLSTARMMFKRHQVLSALKFK